MAVNPHLPAPATNSPQPTSHDFLRSKSLLIWASALLALLPLLLIACGGDDAPVAEEPAAQQSTAEAEQQADPEAAGTEVEQRATPRQRSAVGDDLATLLEDAAELERNGFLDDAATLYAAIISDPAFAARSEAERARVELTHVRLLLEIDDAAAAEQTLFDAESAGGSRSLAPVYQLLLARTSLALGEEDAALEALEAYAGAGGAAEAAVSELRGEILERAGRLEEAAAAYDAAAAVLGAPAAIVESALLRSGVALENAGLYLEARVRYERLAQISPWAGDDAFALHRSGAVSWELGEAQAAREAWIALIREFPWHWRALDAYGELLSRGVIVDGVLPGILFYRHGRLDDARAALLSVLVSEPAIEDSAVAEYYVAAINEDRGDDGGAIAGYLVAADRDPAGALADNALWWTARLLEEGDDLVAASAVYARLANSYPNSPFAEQASFLAAVLPSQNGDWATARGRLQSLALSLEPSPEKQEALLWLGKAKMETGDSQGALAAWDASAGINPTSYYGLRSISLAESLDRISEPLEISSLEADAERTAAWLKSLAGSAAPAMKIDESRPWQAGIELHAAGLDSAALAYFGVALGEWRLVPTALYEAAGELEALGLTHLSVESAIALLSLAAAEERAAAPPEVLQWAYPRAWRTLVDREATDQGIDPLLIYALIRQESRFNPAAGSVAGALGLTQVIPSTGAEIAAALEDDEFEVEALFLPATAIRYGTFYLGRQLDLFDGAIWASLAAYNAGPGNALRWAEASGDDQDRFYETISFAETRLYLQTVLENYSWYRALYGDGKLTLVSSGGER